MKELDSIRDKALRVFSSEDGMDVLTDLMVRLYRWGTLDNTPKTVLHNFSEEYMGFLTGATGVDFEVARPQLRAAMGNLIVPEKPPMIKEGAHDIARR